MSDFLIRSDVNPRISALAASPAARVSAAAQSASASAQRAQTVFVDVAQTATRAEISRGGFALGELAIDPGLIASAIIDFPVFITKVVSQSVLAGVAVARGTAIDLVLANPSNIPVNVVPGVHSAFQGLTMQQLNDRFSANTTIRDIVRQATSADALTTAQRDTLTTALQQADVPIDACAHRRLRVRRHPGRVHADGLSGEAAGGDRSERGFRLRRRRLRSADRRRARHGRRPRLPVHPAVPPHVGRVVRGLAGPDAAGGGGRHAGLADGRRERAAVRDDRGRYRDGACLLRPADGAVGRDRARLRRPAHRLERRRAGCDHVDQGLARLAVRHADQVGRQLGVRRVHRGADRAAARDAGRARRPRELRRRTRPSRRRRRRRISSCSSAARAPGTAPGRCPRASRRTST